MDNAVDPDAIDIGNLFRPGRETILGKATVINECTVTGTRNLAEEIAPSHNDYTNHNSSAADCANCRTPFSTGQIRYPIQDYVHQAVIVSVCNDCYNRCVSRFHECIAKWGNEQRFGGL